jgi:hypothetical protein
VCVCVSVTTVAKQRLGKNPLIVARQRFGKNPAIVAMKRLGRSVAVVTNTHATIEELLDASYSMWPLSYQGKLGDQFFPKRLVILRVLSALPQIYSV